GRLEIVQYERAESTNLYPKACAPARGLLGVSFVVPDVAAVVSRAKLIGALVDTPQKIDCILGSVLTATVYSPAGLRIDLLQVDHH
ncbi:MAG: hypothetical protein ACO3GE_11555, partial [Steroidobacteraceae bacterium]